MCKTPFIALPIQLTTPQLHVANGKTQTQSVLVELHPHSFPDKDAQSALAWQYADQMLHIRLHLLDGEGYYCFFSLSRA